MVAVHSLHTYTLVQSPLHSLFFILHFSLFIYHSSLLTLRFRSHTDWRRSRVNNGVKASFELEAHWVEGLSDRQQVTRSPGQWRGAPVAAGLLLIVTGVLIRHVDATLRLPDVVSAARAAGVDGLLLALGVKVAKSAQ